MIRNIVNEIDLLESSDRIKNKLMILSLYTEFYNEALNSNYSSADLNHMEVDLKAAFKITVSGINKGDVLGSIDAYDFMKYYFETLKYMIMFSNTREEKHIEKFKYDMDYFIESNDSVKLIDRTPFDLKTKTEIMGCFNDYLNYLNSSIIKKCGKENTGELRVKLKEMLLYKLNSYLFDCSNSKQYNLTEMRSMMKESTKYFLIRIFKNRKEKYRSILNNSDSNFFDSLNDTEKDIYLINDIYNISGYSKLNSKEMVEEISKELGISKTKLKLNSLLVTLKTYKSDDKKPSKDKPIKLKK